MTTIFLCEGGPNGVLIEHVEIQCGAFYLSSNFLSSNGPTLFIYRSPEKLGDNVHGSVRLSVTSKEQQPPLPV